MSSHQNFSFNRKIRLDASFNAMIQVKLGRPITNYLIQIVRQIGARLSLSYIKVIINFLSKVHNLVKTNGFKYTVVFQKAQYVNQQQSLGGKPLKDLGPLKCRFSRNNRGLPRIIPAQHRKRIREGDMAIIRLWQSMFSIYRVFSFPYKLKLDSIINENTNLIGTLSFIEGFKKFVPIFIEMLNENFKTEWLHLLKVNKRSAMVALQVKVFFTQNSSPTFKNVSASSPLGQISALYLWKHQPELFKVQKLWQNRTGSQAFLAWMIQGMKVVEEFLEDNPDVRGQSRLGFKEEAAGKQRVFAMLDIITQWVFKSLHDKIFEILRQIPQDGTFDQIKPVNQLQSKINSSGSSRPLYSLDLSSATDRIPVVLAEHLLRGLIGYDLAECWKRILVERDFHYNYLKETGSVRYKVGQPMGALTSWALGQTLLHHSLIQYAAFKAGHKGWFEWYALLGDDILIADGRVALEYRKILSSIGVECGIAKSVISYKGIALEFAKRFIYKGVDVSPIPLKEVLTSCRGFGPSLEQVRKFGLSLSGYLHLLGYGYKSLSYIGAPMKVLPKRLRFSILSYKMGLGGFPLVPSYNESQLEIRQSILDSFRERLQESINDKLTVFDYKPITKFSFSPYFRFGPVGLSRYGFKSPQPMKVFACFTNLPIPYTSHVYNNKAPHEFYSEIPTAADAYLWICETYDMFYHEDMYNTYIKLTEFQKEIRKISLDINRFELYYSLLSRYENDLKGLNPRKFNVQDRVSERFTFRPSFNAKTYMRLLLNK